MSVFRVPYPSDPERRRAFFEKARAMLADRGSCEGDQDSGTFRGSTPVGELIGRYRATPGADQIEIEITRKPCFLPAPLIESEARKFIARNLA